MCSKSSQVIKVQMYPFLLILELFNFPCAVEQEDKNWIPVLVVQNSKMSSNSELWIMYRTACLAIAIVKSEKYPPGVGWGEVVF